MDDIVAAEPDEVLEERGPVEVVERDPVVVVERDPVVVLERELVDEPVDEEVTERDPVDEPVDEDVVELELVEEPEDEEAEEELDRDPIDADAVTGPPLVNEMPPGGVDGCNCMLSQGPLLTCKESPE